MATSVVPTVTTTLKTRLKARAGLSGVLVTEGLPWAPEGDFIAIMGTPVHAQRTAAMRASSQPREETFELTVVLSALRAGDTDHEQVTDRAYQLAAELENDLRGDPTIGGSLGNGWATIVATPLATNGPDAQGNRESRIEARLDCHARI